MARHAYRMYHSMPCSFVSSSPANPGKQRNLDRGIRTATPAYVRAQRKVITTATSRHHYHYSVPSAAFFFLSVSHSVSCLFCLWHRIASYDSVALNFGSGCLCRNKQGGRTSPPHTHTRARAATQKDLDPNPPARSPEMAPYTPKASTGGETCTPYRYASTDGDTKGTPSRPVATPRNPMVPPLAMLCHRLGRPWIASMGHCRAW
mmetsp:Transcript_16608/g.34082  ORF Transcript_16608/g.34082 Transcript_16608/m.34082 type:complete len:205 (+) Transcript_16608:217-831(+)